jgi:hypothetical protein
MALSTCCRLACVAVCLAILLPSARASGSVQPRPGRREHSNNPTTQAKPSRETGKAGEASSRNGLEWNRLGDCNCGLLPGRVVSIAGKDTLRFPICLHLPDLDTDEKVAVDDLAREMLATMDSSQGAQPPTVASVRTHIEDGHFPLRDVNSEQQYFDLGDSTWVLIDELGAEHGWKFSMSFSTADARGFVVLRKGFFVFGNDEASWPVMAGDKPAGTVRLRNCVFETRRHLLFCRDGTTLSSPNWTGFCGVGLRGRMTVRSWGLEFADSLEASGPAGIESGPSTTVAGSEGMVPDSSTAIAALDKGQALLSRAVDLAGGSSGWAAIKSVTLDEERVLSLRGQTMQMTSTVSWQLPDRYAVALKLPIGETRQGFDGTNGWTAALGQVQDSPKASEQMKNEFEHSLFKLFGDFSDLKVEALEEPKTVDGVSYTVAVVKSENTDDWMLYFAPDGALSRMEYMGESPDGGRARLTFVLADWKPVGGIRYPHSEKVLVDGKPMLDSKVTSMMLNPDLADGVFKKPTK